MKDLLVVIVRPLLVLAVLVFVAAAAWSFFATPGKLEMHPEGLFLPQAERGRSFGTVMTYLVIGVVISAFWGLWAALRLDRLGPAVVPYYIVALVAAAAATAKLGQALGPADPASLSDISVGTQVQEQLSVNSPVFWIVWPVAGLVSLLIITYWRLPTESVDD